MNRIVCNALLASLPACQLVCLLIFCCCCYCCLPNLYDVYSTSNVAIKPYSLILCLPPPLLLLFNAMLRHAMPCHALDCIIYVYDPYMFVHSYIRSLSLLPFLSLSHARVFALKLIHTLSLSPSYSHWACVCERTIDSSCLSLTRARSFSFAIYVMVCVCVFVYAYTTSQSTSFKRSTVACCWINNKLSTFKCSLH